MIVKQLVGQLINVTLKSATPLTIKGTLTECDELAICVDQANGKPNLFIPLTAILHIEPVQAK